MHRPMNVKNNLVFCTSGGLQHHGVSPGGMGGRPTYGTGRFSGLNID